MVVADEYDIPEPSEVAVDRELDWSGGLAGALDLDEPGPSEFVGDPDEEVWPPSLARIELNSDDPMPAPEVSDKTGLETGFQPRTARHLPLQVRREVGFAGRFFCSSCTLDTCWGVLCSRPTTRSQPFWITKR